MVGRKKVVEAWTTQTISGEMNRCCADGPIGLEILMPLVNDGPIGVMEILISVENLNGTVSYNWRL